MVRPPYPLNENTPAGRPRRKSCDHDVWLGEAQLGTSAASGEELFAPWTSDYPSIVRARILALKHIIGYILNAGTEDATSGLE